MPIHRLTTRKPEPVSMISAGLCDDYHAGVDCPYFGDCQKAVVEGRVDKLKKLEENGASLTAQPSGGGTLTHAGAVEGDLGILKFLVGRLGPSCLLSYDSEGAAPLHWLSTLGGSMRHLATSNMASIGDRPHTWAHGAPSVRAQIGAVAEEDDGAKECEAGEVGEAGDETSVTSAQSGSSILEGKETYSVLVRAKLRALRWALNLPSLHEHVLTMGEIQEGGFRCPSHLTQEFEALTMEGEKHIEAERKAAAEAKAAASKKKRKKTARGAKEDIENKEAAEKEEVELTDEEMAALAAKEAAERRAATGRGRLANLRDAQQETPLIWACSFEVDGGAAQDETRARERLPLCKLLVASGADPNAQSARGATAMHVAARAGALCLIQYLLYEAKASPAVKDIEGRMPLHYARVYSRDKATIDVLRRSTPSQ